MAPLIDIHCHLDHPFYDKDRDEVVNRAKDKGVSLIITNGINPKTNRQSLELAKKYDIVQPALGIYPIEAFANEANENPEWPHEEFNVDEEISFIRENAKSIAAIGEVGLDAVDPSALESQTAVFRKMISLAQELDLPLIVHSRKAEEQVINILEEMKAKKVIMHCFGGNKKLVKRAADLEFSFSIPPNIIRSHHFQMIVSIVGINYILTETDGPFLAPEQNQRNEPSNIPITIKKIAEIKGTTEEETANNIYMNYQRLFSK